MPLTQTVGLLRSKLLPAERLGAPQETAARFFMCGTLRGEVFWRNEDGGVGQGDVLTCAERVRGLCFGGLILVLHFFDWRTGSMSRDVWTDGDNLTA